MRAPVLIALLALCTAAHAAQPAASSPAPGVEAQLTTRGAAPPLGRLFYTPAERAQLDVARRAKPTPQAPQAEPPAAPPPPQVVSYGGIVRRSDGKAMLWINNRLVEEKEALAGLNLKGRVRPDGAVTLQVPETGGSLEVKVGQSVEVHTGKIAETSRQREAAARESAKAPRAEGTTDPAGGTPPAEGKAEAGPPKSAAPVAPAPDAAGREAAVNPDAPKPNANPGSPAR